MKESIRRIRQDGYSEPLRKLVSRKRIQESYVECIHSDNEHVYVTLPNHTRVCPYYEGIVEKSASVVVALSEESTIEVDTDSHALLRVNGEEVKGAEHNRVLDLSDDGERWEGDVLNDEPYGWGVLYDSENRRMYEGFRLKEVNVCYGIQYYSDIQKVEYEGEICEGKRWGRGVQYDRTGNIVFDGEWMNDDHKMEKRVVLNEENQLLHNHIEELIVSNNSCNGPEWSILDLSFMSVLRLFEVGDECFQNVEEVKLIGLNQLERVVIGKNSFTKHKNSYGLAPNRHFYLKNCERLRELKMGRWSFSDYSVCEIENVPSLEVIEMGELDNYSWNFCYASLELKSESQRMK